ncbi:hypothetical protein B0J12DRAFT_560561 [Macrophomina phaseolina]|uniref:Aminoglycoside phosphotransferase domain-containing protein n=1 Tax=Macrophomina phaseolina TaxID=35725 RepID=A0ABQ8GW31_9PEZI|nr:hypothetical protein B0J12DRAFT_560561 [Macrophomina phaseolina]
MFSPKKLLSRPDHTKRNRSRSTSNQRFSYYTVSDAASSAYSGAVKKLEKVTKKLRHALPSTKRTSKEQPEAATVTPKGPPSDESSWNTAKWGPVLDISDVALARLIGLYTFSTLKKSAVKIQVLDRTAGHNNAVYTMQYMALGTTAEVCIRVPACGWGDHWTPNDAEALRNTALAMRYIKKTTSLPVPTVHQYDTTFNNPIGAPYIMTSFVPGRPLLSVWHDPALTLPALSLEQTRQNILRSLASAMASLRPLTFPSMGPLLFAAGGNNGQASASSPPTTPRVDSAILAPFGAPRGPSFSPADHLSTTETHAKTFFRRCLAESRAYALAVEDSAEVAGVHALFALLLDAIPWSQQPESFVVAPPGFRANNILVDERGEVTGVLDWDGMETVPALVGWAAYPDFLAADVVEGVAWNLGFMDGDVLDGRAWDGYREMYANFLEEACGNGVTGVRKSHWYRVVLTSVGDLDRMRVVLDGVLAEALPRVRRTELVVLAGKGGLTGEKEKLVKERFRELLA